MLDVNTDDAYKAYLPGQRQDDQSLVVRFYIQPLLLGAKSTEAGREIYQDFEFIEIMVKGQPQQVVTRKVRDTDKEKYPNAYHAFKNNQPALVIGTPLDQLPNMSPSYLLTLKGMGLRTMEDIVQLDDGKLQNVGGGSRDLQNRCKAFLNQTSVSNVELAAENKELRGKLDKMQEQLDKILSSAPRDTLSLPKKANNKEVRP